MVKVGWIGTGVMGKHMAGYLQRSAKYGLHSVFNRTESKAQDLVTNGALFQPPQVIASQADYLFLMLGSPKDVENIVLDNKAGVL